MREFLQNFSILEWAHFEYLGFLFLLPVLCFMDVKKRPQSIILSSTRGFAKLPWQPRVFLYRILPYIRILALASLILALARPRIGEKSLEVISYGVDIVLAIDTSGSMKAEDFHIRNERVDRLVALKAVASDFIGRRSHDRIGMVVFGSMAFTQCPLTLDHVLLNKFLNDLEIGMAGEQTAIGSAIGTAVHRLKDLKSESKILILLTDGANTAGEMDPHQAAEIAKSYGIKIYPVGIGSQGSAPMLIQTPMGPMYRQVQSDLDEDLLMALAEKTSGRYFRAQNTEELAQIYEVIDRLERSEAKVKEHTEYQEFFPVFLWLCLYLYCLDLFLTRVVLQRQLL
ncbi:MAG: VWA domain-containing protein [Candidatus Cloacimonetes bacterium]|nr:VWA domain-containing protein [Candidatus Cloacimonadota bacterium]